MSRMGINQYHQIIRETRVLKLSVLPTTGCRDRFFQHAVYLSKVDVAEQWRNHAPDTKGNFQFVRTIAEWREGYALLDLRRET